VAESGFLLPSRQRGSGKRYIRLGERKHFGMNRRFSRRGRRLLPLLITGASLLGTGGILLSAGPAAAFSQEASAWKTFTPKSNVFSALMPGTVKEEVSDVAAVGGKQYLYAAMEPKKYAYTVGYIEFGEKFYSDLEKEIPDTAKRDKTLLEKVLEGFQEGGDFEKVKPTPITVNGLRGYDLIAPKTDEIAFGQMRCFISGRRVFFLFLIQNKEFEDAGNRKKFLDSVRLK
jgi:hypothetical protein